MLPPIVPTVWTRTTLLILLVAAGLVARVVAAMGPLWLDEIWSLQLAAEAASPLEVVTRIKHDNNHLLNTQFLHLLGSGQASLVYRLPAVIAGVLSIVVAGRIAARWGDIEQVTAMALTGSSYFLVHYSSEARGYGTLILCCLLGFALLRRFVETPRLSSAVAFAVVGVLGFLSHVAFLHFYVAAIFWSLTQTEWRNRRQAVTHLAVLHGPIVTTVGLLYWFNWRDIEFGGGPLASLTDVLTRACSLTAGGPEVGIGAVIVAVAFAGVTSAGVWLLRRQPVNEWKLVAFIMILPVVQAVVAQPPFLYERYFLIALVIALLPCSVAMAHLFRSGRGGRVVYAVVLGATILGSALHTSRLVANGRGDFLAVLKFLADEDASEMVSITSDHNHGVGMLVRHYASELQPPRHVKYHRVDQLPLEPPTWLLIHRTSSMQTALPRSTYDMAGGSYQFVRAFETPTLSGWGLHCYRRMPLPSQ